MSQIDFSTSRRPLGAFLRQQTCLPTLMNRIFGILKKARGLFVLKHFVHLQAQPTTAAYYSARNHNLQNKKRMQMRKEPAAATYRYTSVRQTRTITWPPLPRCIASVASVKTSCKNTRGRGPRATCENSEAQNYIFYFCFGHQLIQLAKGTRIYAVMHLFSISIVVCMKQRCQGRG